MGRHVNTTERGRDSDGHGASTLIVRHDVIAAKAEKRNAGKSWFKCF